MGNASKKLAANCPILSKQEQKYVATTFKNASRNSEKIREEDLIVSGKVDADLLKKYWGPLIDPRFAMYLNNFLFGFGPDRNSSATFNRFAELYVFNVRGTEEEKLKLTYNCLEKDYPGTGDEPAPISYQLLREYCEALVSTYIKITKMSHSRRVAPWIEKGFKGKATHVQALGEALAYEATAEQEPAPECCETKDVGRWLTQELLLTHMTELIFTTLFGVVRENSGEQPGTSGEISIVSPIYPNVEGLVSMPDYPAFIDLSHIVWLNSRLPGMLQHKWRFLFSTHIHGQSFATMTGRIQNQGPSIIIIEDDSGYIFGGYATHSWEVSPQFYGSSDSFLFTLAPKIRQFPSRGLNNHYQYFNHHTKTMANGLQMGGQFGFGAIWLDADPFGSGISAESCSTYRNYKRLSKEANFTIRSLEVWGVGDKPLQEGEDERDVSILDVNPEATAILELAGRTRHSEGLREPEPL